MEKHILNGDALKGQFPDSISGELIIMREGLVDGEVSGENLAEVLKTRAAFLEKAYGVTPEQYQSQTISELEKIQQIPEAATVNLWFEDDLFCQVNLWFAAHLLRAYTPVKSIYLVRPDAEHRYGFGGMGEAALIGAYRGRQAINRGDLQIFENLWRHYQAKEVDAMLAIAEDQKDHFPFLPAAVVAHKDRFPVGRNPGRPQRVLQEIMQQIGPDEFGPIFREFWKREGIYGFGDLQVKRLWEELREIVK